MGYLGVSIKPKNTNLSIFVDFGLGYGSRSLPAFNTNYKFDANFGIGYRFKITE